MAKGATAELEKLAAIVREAKDPDTAAKTIQEQLVGRRKRASGQGVGVAKPCSWFYGVVVRVTWDKFSRSCMLLSCCN